MRRGNLFAGSENMVVTGLNDAGHVTGYRDDVFSSNACFCPKAFVHKNGNTIELGTLGGLTSESVAINALGQITGNSGTS